MIRYYPQYTIQPQVAKKIIVAVKRCPNHQTHNLFTKTLDGFNSPILLRKEQQTKKKIRLNFSRKQCRLEAPRIISYSQKIL